MSLQQLQHYATGRWVNGGTEGAVLHNAVTGQPLYRAAGSTPDLDTVLQYARSKGGPALRRLTFHERGRMLKALALYLLSKKEAFYAVSAHTGATRTDSWIDIEGGIGNLFSYASLRREFPDERFYVEGEAAKLSAKGSFAGHHILVPREGVAIHINAFNFPAWGMLEKIAVNLLAGVPAVVKPATLTCYLTEAVFREIIRSEIFPEGALQLICGAAGGILDQLESQDVVTFTGSASTGLKLRSHPRVLSEAVPFNMEADSLNACVLGTDAGPGTPEFNIFIKELHREMTVKAGQKCTAIRRALVPETMVEAVKQALEERISRTVIGDPALEAVRMGTLAGLSQRREVRARVETLAVEQPLLIGDPDHFEVLGADREKGAFLPPLVFFNDDPFTKTAVHEVEVFGPVLTLLPYKDMEEAVTLCKMGKGSLVCSIVTADDDHARDFVLGAASAHGRILVLNRECAAESTGHGSPLPQLVHGGPGRAGGGEEMGGKRGVLHYLQRTAIQGSPTTLTRITNVYQQGARQKESAVHLFRKYFEELEIGDTVTTHKHTVTEADIINFANVSGDHFYVHTDATALEGTIFTRRAAHGYFVLSKAAGLFVDPGKGPVLLNYGIESCRFTKPVYPGMTIGVRLTVKEKCSQEKRDDNDLAKGIVKFSVDVYDETGETVALATILTLVKKKSQA